MAVTPNIGSIVNDLASAVTTSTAIKANEGNDIRIPKKVIEDLAKKKSLFSNPVVTDIIDDATKIAENLNSSNMMNMVKDNLPKDLTSIMTGKEESKLISYTLNQIKDKGIGMIGLPLGIKADFISSLLNGTCLPDSAKDAINKAIVESMANNDKLKEDNCKKGVSTVDRLIDIVNDFDIKDVSGSLAKIGKNLLDEVKNNKTLLGMGATGLSDTLGGVDKLMSGITDPGKLGTLGRNLMGAIKDKSIDTKNPLGDMDAITDVLNKSGLPVADVMKSVKSTSLLDKGLSASIPSVPTDGVLNLDITKSTMSAFSNKIKAMTTGPSSIKLF
jgi:hypothetical protein